MHPPPPPLSALPPPLQDKQYFEVSHREWLFAQREGERYCMYRVAAAGKGGGGPDTGAGGDSHAHAPRLMRITNPYMQWRTQQVGLLLAL